MIRNDILECFILGYALEVSGDGRGRPMSITQLCTAAREQCGDCSMEELLDALYNLGRGNVELLKFDWLPEGRFQVFNFEEVRDTPRWKRFFSVGSFNIKVEPPGRLKFQRLSEQLRTELPLREPNRTRVRGFTA